MQAGPYGNRRQIVGILLAAGKGVRFDPSGVHNKLMQTLPGGECVAITSARTLLLAMPQVLAVVRPGANSLAAALREIGCTVVYCPDADQGMGASLVFALSQARDASGWLIALADMPYVKVTTMNALVEAMQHDADIAVPTYHGRRGNPVGFSRAHLSELMTLGGDQGARSLLKSHAVTEIVIDDAGVLRDIDTPADLP
ncbi:MAG TPA: nucleotidyltransferase family protein [Burkholderiaceae bacterium]|jgi:molybdenum cofactor cytidylyltransferase|nr:nucleotidyltransferase family protein [Burkholderiaceae bacterium]